MATHARPSKSHSNRAVVLIITCALLLLAIIQLPGLVDQWNTVRSRCNDRTDLLTQDDDTSQADILEGQLEESRKEFERLQRAMVSAEAMAGIQGELMELSQTCGCKLRKAVVLAGSSETWELELDPATEDEEFVDEESPYTLGTQQLSLSLSGTREQAFDFLKQVSSKPWLMKIAQINLSRDPEMDGKIAIEANLAFYKLTRSQVKKVAVGMP